MVSIYLYTKICSSFYQCNSCYCSRFTLWADEECTFNMKTGCPFQINIQEIVFISKSENTIGPWSLENIEFFTRNCIGSIFLWFFFLPLQWMVHGPLSYSVIVKSVVNMESSALFMGFVAVCPSLLSTTMIKTMTKSNLWRKGFIWLTCPPHISLLSKAKARTQRTLGTWRQVLKPRPWSHINWCLGLMACLARFLFQYRITCPEVVTPVVSKALHITN